MDSLNKKLEEIAIEHDDRLRIIPAEHLTELKESLEDFRKQEGLNNFQDWIINKLYNFDIPESEFEVNSILIAAIHHPFYARVNFTRDNRTKTFLCLVHADFKRADEYIRSFAQINGYSLKSAKNLPVKRLGVHCGLAKYGRNNITYIDGMGSNFSYVAYYTDMKCNEDTWREMKNAEVCDKCNLCIEKCPTGAILKDRFLIDNQKCLSCVNEVPGDFPDWIPLSAHHTLYDCLKCQLICPMNNKEHDNVVEGILFTEEETDMLLVGKPVDTFSEEMKSKVYKLGINDWYEAIPRNLKTLFDMEEQ